MFRGLFVYPPNTHGDSINKRDPRRIKKILRGFFFPHACRKSGKGNLLHGRDAPYRRLDIQLAGPAAREVFGLLLPVEEVKFDGVGTVRVLRNIDISG